MDAIVVLYGLVAALSVMAVVALAHVDRRIKDLEQDLNLMSDHTDSRLTFIEHKLHEPID